MSPALVDTDILSEILKGKHAHVVQRAADYLNQYGQFTISAVTWYEVLRGLKDKEATAQLRQFRTFCGHTTIHPVTEMILERAADLWVEARRLGRAQNDADLIIAATALEHGLVLATGNAVHFDWITDLAVEDWRQQE